MKTNNVNTATILLLSAACLTLSACVSGTPPMPDQTALPQANLLIKCPSLPPLKPLENAVNNHLESARLYHLCANRVNGWIDWFYSTERITEHSTQATP